MAESREYISREEELGSINVSEEVLAAIAGAAALEVEGVGALGSGAGSDAAAAVSRKALTKSVRLAVENDDVCVDISVLVKYGYVVPEVAQEVQNAVKSAMENTSGLNVVCVNVVVAGVTFSK
ncbi:MAG: Asp23/Gls24 family envelope stress response protein [Candidatus Enterenecus sp.]